MRRSWLWILGLIVAVGCDRHRYLVVYNEYIAPDYLASSYVGTPDPRKCCEFCGQRLIIRWRLPKGSLFKRDEAYLLLTLRFRCEEMEEVCVPMRRDYGTYVYWLMNDEYRQKDGILTYKVEMWMDGELLDVWEHQVWTELIRLDV